MGFAFEGQACARWHALESVENDLSFLVQEGEGAMTHSGSLLLLGGPETYWLRRLEGN